MEKLTGVVLEKDGRHVILLTPLGEFKRVRMSGKLPGIGEEVSIPVAHKRFFRIHKVSWIAAAAAILILLVGNPLLTMVNSGKYVVFNEAVNSGVPIAEKDTQKNSVNGTITSAGSQLQQIINKAGEDKQFGVQEKKYAALASKNESEQSTVAAADTPDQPASPVTASEAGLKPGSDNTVPTESSKESKYVEPIRKNGGPEDQRGKEQTNSGISAAAVTNPPPVKTGSEPVNTPPDKDTVVTVVDDQKTVDNYMGPDQTSNSGPINSPELNDMYKLKPNW